MSTWSLKNRENFEKILSYAKDRNNADAYALLGAYYCYLANQIAPYGRNGSNFGSRWDNSKQKYIHSEETQKIKRSMNNTSSKLKILNLILKIHL